ncbi:hypothetical protein SAC12B_0097 [Lactobacillus phage SAC12B]|uniref:Uncharacterized protein n=1 Tax=Lactobacillus phage SAC12B TaxID=2510941 RepID=A0A4Y5FFM1_9CAUD|nr:hypothetical protein HWC10_gp097 [Lactobacillus phage SAC12B]QBJ03886.1 hypothetical protein SAC12B_0097 [Lactobacillus phage SAC12B]
MTDEQYEFLDKLRNALQEQPEEPNYENYENGNLDEFYDLKKKWQVVQDIYFLLENQDYM